MDQDVPQLVQAEPIKKSNSFEKEATELKAKIYSKNYIGEVEDFEDSSDTDSSFGDIDSENEVKKVFLHHFGHLSLCTMLTCPLVKTFCHHILGKR